MKLYHFTNLGRFFDAPGTYEWTADLVPRVAGDNWPDFLGHAPPPMVWLTSEADPDPSLMFSAHTPDTRLTLEIGPNSRRLVLWIDYVRRYRPDARLDAGASWGDPRSKGWGGPQCIYAYFGTISQDRIVAVDHPWPLLRD